MGGTSGEIRGSSKGEVFAKYAETVKRQEHTFGDQYPDAKCKKMCKDMMVQDPETGEWVLRYRFHT